jgi:hypothetical protein
MGQQTERLYWRFFSFTDLLEESILEQAHGVQLLQHQMRVSLLHRAQPREAKKQHHITVSTSTFHLSGAISIRNNDIPWS